MLSLSINDAFSFLLEGEESALLLYKTLHSQAASSLPCMLALITEELGNILLLGSMANVQ